MKKKVLLSVYILLTSFYIINAQSAKDFYKAGLKEFKKYQYDASIVNFSEAIKLDTMFVDAYFYRAEAYSKLDKAVDAIADYNFVNKLEPKNEEAWFNNGNLNFALENYKQASEKYKAYLLLEKKDLDICNKQIKALMNIEAYNDALSYAFKALDIKKSAKAYFEIARLYFILKNFKESKNYYQMSLLINTDFVEARNGMAKALYELSLFNEVIKETNTILARDNNNKQAFLTRSYGYRKQLDYINAINDISKVIVLYSDDDDYLDNLNFRGDLYLEFNQHMNAISDYSKVLNNNPNNPHALFNRAKAYEDIMRTDAAIADLSKIVNIAKTRSLLVNEDVLNNAKSILYELKRENVKPDISITNDNVEDRQLRIAFNKEEVELNIVISDKNPIKSFSIDGETINAENNIDSLNYLYLINLTGKENITISAEDTYGNISSKIYKIKRVENDVPQISFIVPFTNDQDEMYLENDEPVIYFEGKINDESMIKSITFDEVIIPFDREEMNPNFSISIDLQEKAKIIVKITDIYDNTMIREFYLNREGTLFSEDNPMGKTWVIFIENSNYETFASLDGPIKDIRLMKSALANYEIHNILHFKNLTKRKMEKFFSIELRDLIKDNHVNSLVIWYSGHGKFQNETGYWIPIDADRTDEFSYFNINNLKASMQIYSNYITHTLVITDACESGPSFYQAMRAAPNIRDCSDEKASKFKSSQVFSSAGYELATDNSQFTKTFANSLINNSSRCIPIESIVLKVSDAVEKVNSQKPQFGNIVGLKDENGTFFFIKRQTDDDIEN
jgi:tetratricopeptide (TPR) repeat protein